MTTEIYLPFNNNELAGTPIMKVLFAIGAEPRGPVDGYELPFVFQVVCDGNRTPIRQAALGVWGNINNADDRYPFILLPDGQIDFGADYAGEPNRHYETNLLTKEMQVGELFTVTFPDEDRGERKITTTFEIVRVVPLNGPAPESGELQS